MDIIDTQKIYPDFSRQVMEMSHTNPGRCWHCLACSGGCPVSEDMDIAPNAVLRMVQLGLKEAALSSSTIWLCVGCNTCSTECPNAIDIAAIMDSLRQIVLEENGPIAQPNILSFHRAVVDSIYRHGRTHKLEIMMRYKLAEKNFLSDIDLGLKMLSKRKLDLLPSRINDKKILRSLFKTREEEK